jgi:hypothetical protein
MRDDNVNLKCSEHRNRPMRDDDVMKNAFGAKLTGALYIDNSK